MTDTRYSNFEKQDDFWRDNWFDEKAEDYTQGYRSGDPCPLRCGGIITIRSSVPPGRKILYAQCSRCYWSTYP